MQCMKCGRDLEAGEVFCTKCQEVMAQYPVKPGTVVQLPHRPQQTATKKQPPRRKNLPVEEQLSLLKRMSRTLALALVAMILVSIGLGYVALTQYFENQSKQAVGQNYSAISTTEATTVPTDTTAIIETENYAAG